MKVEEWHVKVIRRFERDFSNPYLGKKLRDFPYYSLRVGDYRVIYMIDEREHVIILMTVFHRRVGYRRIISS